MRRSAFHDPKFIGGALCIAIIVAIAIFGTFVISYDPRTQDLMDSLEPPSFATGHWFGTDHLGRDILARAASGARVSLLIAAAVVLVSGVIGTFLGALSGYLAGARDVVMQKIVETFWAFPAILLAIAILSFFGQSLTNLIIALVIQRWIPYCRVARAQALVLRSRDFVSASRTMGGGVIWILRRHIIPNLWSSVIVIATFSMATAILAEASLSFLGLGVPPEVPTWGGMLAEGRSYVTNAWWIAVFPGMCIFLTVLGLNLLGDWLHDAYDPKHHLNLR